MHHVHHMANPASNCNGNTVNARPASGNEEYRSVCITVVRAVMHNNTAETSMIKYNSDVDVETSNADGGSIFIIVPRLGGGDDGATCCFSLVSRLLSKVAISSISIDVIIVGMSSMRLVVTIRPNSSAATTTLSIGVVVDCTIIRDVDEEEEEDDDIVIIGRRAS